MDHTYFLDQIHSTVFEDLTSDYRACSISIFKGRKSQQTFFKAVAQTL